jgi:hypothetical protein
VRPVWANVALAMGHSIYNYYDDGAEITRKSSVARNAGAFCSVSTVYA